MNERNWFTVTDDDDAVEVDIYGPIGRSWYNDDATAASDVLNAVKQAKGRDIILHVNSEGGSVFDAYAIFSVLRDCPSKVIAYVDGLAASAASYIIAAADEVIMSDVAWIMIHEASTFALGNKRSLSKEVEILENIDNTISSIYTARGTKTQEEFLSLMEEETWLDADAAKELGLVDTISRSLPKVAFFDLRNESILDKAPAKAVEAIYDFAHKDPSDTTEKIHKDGKEGAMQEQGSENSQEADRFAVLDGKIFEIKEDL